MIIRDADQHDTPHILSVYAPYITDTTVTFENEIPTVQEFYERVAQYQLQFPWLVAEASTGEIAGYAYASKYRERIAYQWVVEASVYIHEKYKGKGIGQKLYHALFDILRLQGIYRVYAVIGLPNDESVRFHEKMGFTWFATYKSTGYKSGQWRDTGWWELVLAEPKDNPEPPQRYPQLEKQNVEEIFKRYSS